MSGGRERRDREPSGVSWTLDARFDQPANASVFAYLRSAAPSAHSDVASELTDAARALPDVRTWCPDPQAYAFVALATRERTVFALARGMRSLVFALPEAAHAAAFAAGARACPEIGPAWVEWLGLPPAELARWCKLAHDHALRGGSSPAR